MMWLKSSPKHGHHVPLRPRKNRMVSPSTVVFTPKHCMFLSPSNTVFGICQCSSLRIDGKKTESKSLVTWSIFPWKKHLKFKKSWGCPKTNYIYIWSTRLYGPVLSLPRIPIYFHHVFSRVFSHRNQQQSRIKQPPESRPTNKCAVTPRTIEVRKKKKIYNTLSQCESCLMYSWCFFHGSSMVTLGRVN